MPKKGKKISPEELAVIERWIAQGAKTAKPEPESLRAGMFITEEDREFWAFQPCSGAGGADGRGREAAGAHADRRLRAREAARAEARLRAGSRSPHADPPRDARSDRPAADAGGSRGLPRRHRRRTPTRSSSIACSPRRLRRALGAALARCRGLRRLQRLHGSGFAAACTRGAIATTSSARSTPTSRGTSSSSSNSRATNCGVTHADYRAGGARSEAPRRAHRHRLPAHGPRRHGRRRAGPERCARNQTIAETDEDRLVVAARADRRLRAVPRSSLRSRSRRRTTTACAPSSSRPSTGRNGAAPRSGSSRSTRPEERAKADEIEKQVGDINREAQAMSKKFLDEIFEEEIVKLPEDGARTLSRRRAPRADKDRTPEQKALHQEVSRRPSRSTRSISTTRRRRKKVHGQDGRGRRSCARPSPPRASSMALTEVKGQVPATHCSIAAITSSRSRS